MNATKDAGAVRLGGLSPSLPVVKIFLDAKEIADRLSLPTRDTGKVRLGGLSQSL